ncbi:prepilin-type N-terminal cleavage/methylation domain-containing protein [Longibaculum muris]|uniref:prepilin-type N-terminal cleavage/methylation domain-containing protein n=1 Tax=Longibaculum muris TaxID=1796628 RepID=UPI0022E3FE0C|nr:prepilin-type N-terminal cleavage/methylation domain-containing protein [Longibaculum muris]
MRQNKNGFTLIEIIVSLAIGSIVLLIAGTMIVSSSGFLSTTTDYDIDKRALDSIIEFVRDEAEYSYDVRLMSYNDKDAPKINDEDDWHCFYVKDKILYMDNEKIYNESFYSHKELKMKAKGNFQNGSRVDLYYEFWNAEGEKTYSSRDTVMFLNVEVSDNIKKEGLFTQNKVDLVENGYRLYFRKSKSSSSNIVDKGEEDDSQSTFTGTVADQIDFLAPINNRGKWEEADQRLYNLNDFVYKDGFWWMLIYGNGSEKDLLSIYTSPGNGEMWWKCIDSHFHDNSAYQVGDVVIDNGQYYRCKVSNVNKGIWGTKPSNDPNRWELVNSNDETFSKDGKHGLVLYENVKQKNTIIRKLEGINLEKAIPLTMDMTNIPVVDDPQHPKQGEVYKISEDNYVRYFIKLFNTNKTPYNSGITGWQEICVDFKSTNSYAKNDIVLYGKDSIKYIKALKDIDFATNPNNEVYNQTNWEKYE